MTIQEIIERDSAELLKKLPAAAEVERQKWIDAVNATTFPMINENITKTPKDHLLVRLADLKDMLDKFKENERREDPYTCVILHLNALNGEKYTWTMGVDKHPA